MNEDLQKRIEQLENWKKSLESSHSIPLNIDQSIRGRFGFSRFRISPKSASSEDITIDEGGVAVKTVLNNPNGYLEGEIEGLTVNVPYFL